MTNAILFKLVHFYSESWYPPTCFSSIVSAVLETLSLLINFTINLTISSKQLPGTRIDFTLSLQITLERFYLFTMMSLPIHERRVFFKKIYLALL